MQTRCRHELTSSPHHSLFIQCLTVSLTFPDDAPLTSAHFDRVSGHSQWFLSSFSRVHATPWICTEPTIAITAITNRAFYFKISLPRVHCSATTTTMSRYTPMIFKSLGTPRFECSVRGNRATCSDVILPIITFSRVSFISFSDYSSGYGSTIRPKELSRPHRISFSTYHLVHPLPNDDDVCPYDDIKPPHQQDSASSQPPTPLRHESSAPCPCPCCAFRLHARCSSLASGQSHHRPQHQNRICEIRHVDRRAESVLP